MLIVPRKKRLDELITRNKTFSTRTNGNPHNGGAAAQKILWLNTREANELAARGELAEPNSPRPRPCVRANSKTVCIDVFHRARTTSPVTGNAGRWMSRQIRLEATPQVARRLLLGIERDYFVANGRTVSHLRRISETTCHPSQA